MRAFLPLALLAVLACGAAAETEPPPDPDLGTLISDAVAFDGQLWVLGSPRGDKDVGGVLVSFTLSDGTRQLRADHVIGLQKTGGHLFVLDVPDGRTSRLREWNDAAFAPVAPLPYAAGDMALSLFDADGDPGITTKTGIFTLKNGAWHTIETYSPAPPGAFGADAFGSSTTVYGMPASGTALY